MKQFFSLLSLAVIASTALAQSNKSIIKCQFDNLPGDSLHVQIAYSSHPDDMKDEIAYAKKGKYQLEVADDYAVNVMFAEKPKPGQRGYLIDDITRLTVLPGEKITVKGSVKGKAVIKGSAFEDEQKALDALTKTQDDEMRRLVEERTAKVAAGEDEEKVFNDYSKLITAQQDQKNAIITEYVKSHTDSPLSIYHAAYDMMDKDQLMQYVTEKGKNGVMKYFIEQMDKYASRIRESKAKMAALEKAESAPDFTAKDLDGNDLTLSSLYNKGNYILLDFWGSWCHWCIKALPKMKKVYEAHKDHFQILSVDCNDTEDRWRKAVAEHELTWLNVKNEQDIDIPGKYGVQGYPTFVFISPEGKILKVQTGTDDEFYKYLEDTLSK